MSIFDFCFFTNLLCCVYMTGVIWVIQIVHYPLYDYISQDRFTEYQKRHIRAITPVVAPFMILEWLASAILCWQNKNNLYLDKFGIWIYVAAALSLVVLLNTVLQSVPIHSKLKTAYDAAIVKNLLEINWIRTIAWTLKSLLLISCWFWGWLL